MASLVRPTMQRKEVNQVDLRNIFAFPQNPTVDTFRYFCEGINAFFASGRTLDNCTFVPFLKKIADNETKDDTKLLLIEGLRRIVEKCEIYDVVALQSIYNTVFPLILDTDAPRVDSRKSEEMKLEVIQLVYQAMKRSTVETLIKFFEIKNVVSISPGLLIAVQLARDEKFLPLKVAALDFLTVALNRDEELNIRVGDIYMCYLPGLVDPLHTLCSWNETQPHIITKKSIKAFGEIISCVMVDNPSEEQEPLPDTDIYKQWVSQSQNMSESDINHDLRAVLNSKDRTKEWLTAAGRTLKPVICKTLSKVQTHSNSLVRQQLADTAGSMLSTAGGNLYMVAPFLVELLIGLLQDMDDQVRVEAQYSLQVFVEKIEVDSHQFVDYLHVSLAEFLQRLPREVYTANGDTSPTHLGLLAGYLNLLHQSKSLTQFLSIAANSNSLIKGLTTVLQLCPLPLNSTQTRHAAGDEEGVSKNNDNWKILRHFVDQSQAWAHLKSISSTLAKAGDWFINLLWLGRPTTTSLALLGLMLGNSDVPPPLHVVKDLFSLLEDPELSPLYSSQGETWVQQQEHLVQLALTLELIGAAATCLGRLFELYIVKTLHIVLENINSPYSFISATAMKAAEDISKACGLDGSIGALVDLDLDTLTYHVLTKLNKPDHSESMLNLVVVIAKFSGAQGTALTGLQHIVVSVLNCSSHKTDTQQTLLYLRIFQTFLSCIDVKYKAKKESTKDPMQESLETCIDDFEAFIDKANKKEEDDNDEDAVINNGSVIDEEEDGKEGVEEDGQDDMEEAEQTEKMPKEIELVVEIGKRCLHYMTSKERDITIAALGVLSSTLLALSSWQNQLLPLVHQVWSPLVLQFQRKPPEPLLVARSFDLLVIMATLSKDFIRSRTLKQVLPSLSNFLMSSADTSRFKDSGSGYYYTQVYKLQRQLLQGLYTLVVDLSLLERDTDCILKAVLPYLSATQPRPLQEYCCELVTLLQRYDPYLVWLRLKPLQTITEYKTNVNECLQLVPTDFVTPK